MPKFGNSSKEKLGACDPRIREILNDAIELIDFTIICGYRKKEEQERALREGFSKVAWPNSKHNYIPSKAVDIAQYWPQTPHIHWNDSKSFTFLAGIITGIAHGKGYKIRWGGDFNKNYDLHDDKFVDLPHFEIID